MYWAGERGVSETTRGPTQLDRERQGRTRMSAGRDEGESEAGNDFSLGHVKFKMPDGTPVEIYSSQMYTWVWSLGQMPGLQVSRLPPCMKGK